MSEHNGRTIKVLLVDPRPVVIIRTIKVLLVDPRPVVIIGLRTILDVEGIEVMGEVSEADRIIPTCRTILPDVIIIDMNPLYNRYIPEISDILSGKGILLFCDSSMDIVDNALRLGATGCIAKDSESGYIRQSVFDVSKGIPPLSPDMIKDILSKYRVKISATLGTILTERQINILKFIAQGVNTGDIGRKLYLSNSTVKREARNIYNKLGTNDRAAAVAEAIRRGYI